MPRSDLAELVAELFDECLCLASEPIRRRLLRWAIETRRPAARRRGGRVVVHRRSLWRRRS